MKCLPEVQGARQFNEYRHIALSAVLQKFYLACLVEWCRVHSPMLRCNVLGFERGKSVLEIVETIRHLLGKAQTWDTSAVIAGGDTETAFDSMVHSDMAWSPNDGGIDRHIAAAFMREMLDLEASVGLGEVRVEGVEYTPREVGKEGRRPPLHGTAF